MNRRIVNLLWSGPNMTDFFGLVWFTFTLPFFASEPEIVNKTTHVLRSPIHWFSHSTVPEFVWKRTGTTSSAGSRSGCLVAPESDCKGLYLIHVHSLSVLVFLKNQTKTVTLLELCSTVWAWGKLQILIPGMRPCSLLLTSVLMIPVNFSPSVKLTLLGYTPWYIKSYISLFSNSHSRRA